MAKGSNKEKDAAQAKEDAGSDEFNLDFSAFKNFFANKKLTAILITTLLILIPVILTIYIRVQPWYLPQTDVWAQSSVDNYFRSQIASAVDQQYPNLPQANKDALIDQQFAEFKRNNAENLKQQAEGTAAFFKEGFQYQENNKSYTFLGDLDSYYYLRQARNLEATGSICDEMRDGQCWDDHMIAPLGIGIGVYMHPYGIVAFHKFLNFFDSSVNLMQTAFYLPTLLAVICAIAAFFIGRKLMNNTAGFFAAMFLAVSPMFISRSLGSDTDIWNIMFPLLIIWVFLEAFESKSTLKRILFIVLTGIFIGLFSFAWSGWWYIFDFIMAALMAYLGFEIIRFFLISKNMKGILTSEVKNSALMIGLLFLSSLIFVTLLTSFGNFKSAFASPMATASGLKIAAHANLWPNVYTTVAELNEADLGTIISQTSFGSKILFSLALLGIIFLLVKRKPGLKDYLLVGCSALVFLYLSSASAISSLSVITYLMILLLPVAAGMLLLLKEKGAETDIKPALILIIWFIGMIFASTKGVRFILLLVPAFSVGIGVAIGYLHQYFARILKDELNLSHLLSKVVVFAVLCTILIMPIQAGFSAGNNFTPSMTRGWWDSLTKIQEESEPDAIINSWWDFGHWFKYVADRRVTLDGASQNHPNAHWLGKILQTGDEREALGILRMLDCGSNNAFEEINKKYDDTEKSQNIVAELILMDKEEGEKKLSEIGYSEEEIGRISSFLYCDPPENYFITSEDMVGKAGVWAHFGLWDFDRAFIINNVRSKDYDEAVNIMKDRWNYSDEEAGSIYYEVQALQTDREMNDWISTWPNYFIADWLGCKVTNITGNSSDLDQVNSSDLAQEENADAEARQVIGCAAGIVISQDSSGMRTVIDGIIYEEGSPENIGLIIGSYDSMNAKKGSGKAMPNAFIIYTNNSVERKVMENVTFPYDVIIDIDNNRAIISHPLLSESLFTKLFFLEGRATSHFEKFSDVQDITGQRIIVWKVNWD